MFWGEKPDRKKDVSEVNLMERRSFLTERSFLGEKPDRKKEISDKKKDISEENLMERWRFLTEIRVFLRET